MKDDDNDPRRPWLAQREFWRQVTIQACGGIISGIVLLTLGYTFGVLAGYLTVPDADRRWTLVLSGALVFLLMFVGALITWGSARQMGRVEGRGAFLRYLIGVGVIFLAMFAPLIVFLVAGVGESLAR